MIVMKSGRHNNVIVTSINIHIHDVSHQIFAYSLRLHVAGLQNNALIVSLMHSCTVNIHVHVRLNIQVLQRHTYIV